VLNCFAFETAPTWTGAPPTPLARVRRSAGVPWLLEAADLFNTFDSGLGPFDDIFAEPFHIIRSPENLPGGAKQRITETRHVGGRSNILYADGHVAPLSRGELTLQMLDDGVRRR
jgi:prepilin-type processing-associated H-X9-DG protein